jgi:hypothetical protein
MKVILVFWVAAVALGFATRGREDVIEFQRNTTGCLPNSFSVDSNPAVLLMAPISSVASFCVFQIGFARPSVAGFAALTAVTLAYMFAERLAGADKLALAAAAALTANASIAWLSDAHKDVEVGALSRAVFAGIAVYLSLSDTSTMMPLILAVIPLCVVAVEKSERSSTVPLAALCGITAAVLFLSADRDAGVCSNDVPVYQKQDWMHAFGLFLWAATVSLLIGEEQRECQKVALGATSVAALALASSGFENGWMVLGLIAAASFVAAEVCDEFNFKIKRGRHGVGTTWRLTLS